MHRNKKRPASTFSQSSTPTPARAVRFRAGEEPVAWDCNSPGQELPRQLEEDEADAGEDDLRPQKASLIVQVSSGLTETSQVLSLHVPQGNTLAAASYDPEWRKVYVLEDTKDTHGWDLAVLLMEQTRADDIIVSSRAPDSLVDQIEAYCAEERNCTFQIQSSNSFSLANAYNAVTSIHLPDRSVPVSADISSSPTRTAEEDQSFSGIQHSNGYALETGAGLGKTRLALVKLGCWMNVNALAAVAATGGLISFLIKQPYLNDTGPFELAGIESLDLEQHMLINHDALTSLAIFEVGREANRYAGRSQQALSIFGIFNNCVTPLGKKLLNTWHLRPLFHVEAIQERHDAVELLSSAEHHHTAQLLHRTMRRIGNITGWCNNIRQGKAKMTDWKGMIESLLAAREVRELVVGIANSVSVTLRIAKRIQTSMKPELEEFMSQVIGIVDWDASRDEKRICVRIGVDDVLDDCRQRLAELEPLLNLVATKLSPNVPLDFCKSLNVVYFPQLGYLVAVEPSKPSVHAPETWEFKFESEENQYYKTPEMENLDEHFGDLHSLIIERELLISQDMTEQMKLVEPFMMAVVDGIAELDCLLSLARAVNKYHLVRPKMTEEPILEIREGRHILFEMTMDNYISNDTMLAGGDHEDLRSMMIITGANGSGKSAYGKQVALIVYMAQVGGFVPAKSAKIGVVDKIYTRLQTRESSTRVGSAFMIDLSQVSHALRGATDRSLIILDEFGKGTTSADGAGLLAGTIEYLLMGPCPRTIVMTHFHELFARQLLLPELPILFCHMKTVFFQGDNDITYLYKLSPTLSTTSNAAECALLHGVPPEVVERGREVTELMTKFELAKLLDRELSEDEKAELEDAEYLAQRFLEWKIDADTQDVMEVLKDMVQDAEQRSEDRAAQRKGASSETASKHDEREESVEVASEKNECEF